MLISTLDKVIYNIGTFYGAEQTSLYIQHKIGLRSAKKSPFFQHVSLIVAPGFLWRGQSTSSSSSTKGVSFSGPILTPDAEDLYDAKNLVTKLNFRNESNNSLFLILHKIIELFQAFK
jgi:hypothetical protein